MDRKAACLMQAGACLAKAEADPLNGAHWTAEAGKWLERAVAPGSPVVVTIEQPHLPVAAGARR